MAILQNVELKSKKGRAFITIVYTILVLYMFVQFAPLVWLALGTFKENKELIRLCRAFCRRYGVRRHMRRFSANITCGEMLLIR